MPEVKSLVVDDLNCREDSVFVMSSVSINGASYKSGLVFILNVSEQNIPFFVPVNKLILCAETVVLVCFNLKPIYYDCHLHAYVVEVTNKLSFFNPHLLDMYVVGARNCMRMRYNVYSREVQSSGIY